MPPYRLSPPSNLKSIRFVNYCFQTLPVFDSGVTCTAPVRCSEDLTHCRVYALVMFKLFLDTEGSAV